MASILGLRLVFGLLFFAWTLDSMSGVGIALKQVCVELASLQFPTFLVFGFELPWLHGFLGLLVSWFPFQMWFPSLLDSCGFCLGLRASIHRFSKS